ncbi:MAG: ABC transporter permease [Thermomicrobiales bacterium]|jgi:peptide/nickel transport system permease protein|nr:ABC transporter permease [Thermomicrobiales bacterium]
MSKTLTLAQPAIEKQVRQRSLWIDAFDRFRRNKMAVGSLAFIIFVLLTAVFGPIISPYDPLRQNLLDVAKPPSMAHWFGTDSLGRDYLTRVMMGGRTAFLVAVVVTTITTVMGVLIGTSAAYWGRWFDNLIMRLTDIIMAFPHLLLAMFIAGTIRPRFLDLTKSITWLRGTGVADYLVVFGALAVVSWPGYARLIRGQVLSLVHSEFIAAERMLGASSWKIMRDHLIPNALGPVIVALSAQFGGAMLLESSLSFLGIGIQPPGASWGNMISDNLLTWRYQPHLLAIPGIVLTLVVLAFNFLGDGLNDALNPRARR